MKLNIFSFSSRWCSLTCFASICNTRVLINKYCILQSITEWKGYHNHAILHSKRHELIFHWILIHLELPYQCWLDNSLQEHFIEWKYQHFKVLYLLICWSWQNIVAVFNHLIFYSKFLSKQGQLDKQSGTKPNLVAKILVTNFGVFL